MTIAVFFFNTWLSRVRIADPQKAFVTEDAPRSQKPFNYKDDMRSTKPHSGIRSTDTFGIPEEPWGVLDCRYGLRQSIET